MSNQEERYEGGGQGDFWSQVPVVLFAIAAIVAIFVVNQHTEAAVSPAATPAETEIRLETVACPDCGQVIGVHPADAADPAAGNLFDVRMLDGSVRIIRMPSAAFAVGDPVQVTDDGLIAPDPAPATRP